jgi:lipoprotein-anchoring transpeptidase ErfK/SrfK
MHRPLIAFAAVVLGCAVPAAGAVAQFFPPGAYRVPPPPIDRDDEDEALPGEPGQDPRAVRPYRSSPPGYEPRGPAPRFASPYPDAEPYALRPPGEIGNDPRGYGGQQSDPTYPPYRYRAPPPGYGSPGYGPPEGYAAQPGYGAQPGYQAPGAQPGYGPPGYGPQPGYGTAPAPVGPGDRRYAALPPEYQAEEGAPKELPPQFRRQLVDYRTSHPAGTIVVDTANTYLYLVLGNGKAMRYGIGVGREGFTWAGEERISGMKEWPDWHPPADMIERQPYLPRFMAGGPGNPLGARALYLGKSLYRIHGTNQPSTIGQFVSSGCIRLLNQDIEDLYGRVTVGTRVVVLDGKKHSPGIARESYPPPQFVR